MHCSGRGTGRPRNLALWLVSSAITNRSAEPGPNEPNRANWAFKISLIGVLFLVPIDLFVSSAFISNIGLFTQIGALLIIFFVFSLGVAIPLATMLLHFDAKQRVAWGIILVASSSVLGFLSIAAELINFGASGSVGGEAGLLTFLSVTTDIGCPFHIRRRDSCHYHKRSPTTTFTRHANIIRSILESSRMPRKYYTT